ncbi:Crp/Fnr family transcriptional regulator [Flavobacterium psychrotrophum]|uniref:Crp/Fnr family transcriptional regulator n=1 Tax=Flavobacterium psychrotrophum TaxID=2294119 RepID=UPI000E31B93C|nr:Crp/Fnr family transcriptional regulator [Flavobacterium psychrotrophum]
MVNILNTITTLYPLSQDELSGLVALFSRVELSRGEIIIREGYVEDHLFFIEQGIARAYSDATDKQVTFWFGMPGDYIISAHSFANNRPGYESIEVLEDSIMYKVKSKDLIALFEKNVALANWGRKLAERELLKLEEMFIKRQFKTASQLYIELLERIPSLPNRVPLKYIASYLGISQVSLSRIRANVAKGTI